MLALDQHDKWLRFGLALHNGVDPFAGQLQWMKVWTMNHNLKVILSYYLEFIEKTTTVSSFLHTLFESKLKPQ